MIFAHTLNQVLGGQKQQTRRLVKPEEKFENNRYIIKTNLRVLYEIGKTYAVQPNRGKKSVARILITGIRKEQVGSITHADAKAEGFISREDFLNTWRTIHGKDANLSREVWVFEFELCGIVDEGMKTFYADPNAKNQSPHHSENLPRAVAEVSGSGVYSRDYRIGRVGTTLSDRLSVSETRSPVQEISVD